MARQGPRLHRLPHRLDYTLIPAPLDLSLPDITEKSPLPAIIVTPSSPIHTHDYSIAFLAPPPKPTIRQRIHASINTMVESSWLGQSRSSSLRTLLILALLFFIMMTTHLIIHKAAAYSYNRFDSHVPHRTFAFDSTTSTPHTAEDKNFVGDVPIWTWIGFEFRKAWSVGGGVAVEENFVIETNVSEWFDSPSGSK